MTREVAQTFEGKREKKSDKDEWGENLKLLMVILLAEDSAVAPSFGDGGCCLVEGGEDASSCQEKKMMDDKISPIEGQLQYLLNKADEIQVELVWRCDNRIFLFVLRRYTK